LAPRLCGGFWGRCLLPRRISVPTPRCFDGFTSPLFESWRTSGRPRNFRRVLSPSLFNLTPEYAIRCPHSLRFSLKGSSPLTVSLHCSFWRKLFPSLSRPHSCGMFSPTSCTHSFFGSPWYLDHLCRTDLPVCLWSRNFFTLFCNRDLPHFRNM